MSRFDHLYRSLLLTKFFTKGWGKPDNLKRLFEFRKLISNREICQTLVADDYPIHIDKEDIQKECRILEGHFLSPFVKLLPGIMPKEVEVARFQVILPLQWNGPLKPICLHLAGTGDHRFWRRRVMLARPLLKEGGIGSIILENPYYGVRKPKQQLRSSLQNVSDLFVMGGALVVESLALLHWCERQGFGPLGITGISMGGHMASLAATNWTKPLSLVPCLSWSTASCVFTQGVMSDAIPWPLLKRQYLEDRVYEDELAKLIHSPEQNRANVAFVLGQSFAKNYPVSLDQLTSFQDKYFMGDDNGQKSSKFVPEHISPNADSGSSPLGSQGKHAHFNQSDSSGKCSNTFSSRHSQLHTMTTHGHPESRLLLHYDSIAKLTSRTKSDFLHIKSTFQGWRGKKRNMQPEIVDFMRGIMDECTHLGNFSVPVDPSLIIIVVAKSDAYIPRDSVLSLQDLWPGADVRYVDTGHITAFLFKQKVFRQAIIDAFDRQIMKYYS